MERTDSNEPTTAQLNLTIERMVPGGWGLAHGGGNTYLVRGGLTGEVVAARATGERGRAIAAEVVEVITASPERVVPPCPVANVCGGCDLQHLSYPGQLAAKREMVIDAFRRIGGITLGEGFEVAASPKPFQYRTRASWHLEPMTGDFGYLAAESNQVIDVETCPVLEPELDETLRRTREGIRSGLTAAITYVAAAGDDSANAFGGSGEPLPLYRTVGPYRYRFDASTFFQANGSLLDELVAEALWQIDSMPQEQRRTALDLYSGVGLFSLPLSEQFEQVVGVESDAGAVKHFKRNAKSNDRRNVLIHSVETKRFFRDQKKLARRANFALLDPPRIGLDKDTRDGLIEALPPVLTYVSCDATTLARDLKALLANGYELQRVRGLDCFPQTHHVEVVAHLRLP